MHNKNATVLYSWSTDNFLRISGPNVKGFQQAVEQKIKVWRIRLTVVTNQMRRIPNITQPKLENNGLVWFFNLFQVRKKQVLLKKRYQRLTKSLTTARDLNTQIQAKIHNSEGRKKQKEKKQTTPVISCFNKRKCNFGQTTLLIGFCFWMPECSVSQTYRFMYKQHVTSPVPYIFIRLSDLEDKYCIQTCPFKVNFTFGFFFYFHLKGP